MKKQNAKKIVLLTLCAVALVVITVLGTLAYFTSTDNVKNSFTAGKVVISLDEGKLSSDGRTVDSGVARVKANTYNIVPGAKYDKDPVVHVEKGSENAWIFVKVDNGISAIEDSTNTIAAQITANGWTALGVAYPGVYYREYTQDNTKDVDYKVFETFKVSTSETAATLSSGGYTSKSVDVTAYAIQKETLTSATDAWAALQ